MEIISPRRDKLYLKVLIRNNREFRSVVGPYSGFDFTEYLPVDGKPGKWTPVVENLFMCESGWHVTAGTAYPLLWNSRKRREVYVVQVRGGRGIFSDGKAVFHQIRFICKTGIGVRAYYRSPYKDSHDKDVRILTKHIDRAYKKAKRILREERNSENFINETPEISAQ